MNLKNYTLRLLLAVLMLLPFLGYGQTYNVTTLAGSGTQGYANGTGSAASFYSPTGVAVDGSGNVYVADQDNHRIRKISPEGVVTTLAGSGTFGYADGTGTAASINRPIGVAVDASGNVYVADRNNNRIRKISPAGVVTTLAGFGTEDYADGTGTAARFAYPTGVAVDGSGNVYVADQSNHRIRKISPAGVVTTLAGSSYGYADGTGTAASFYYPTGVAVDGSGNVYVADQYNHRIRKISPAGVVTTLAGSGTSGNTNGTGTAARFNSPTGVTVDGSGNVYVADYSNHRIRKISPEGVVTTLAGSGTRAYADGTGTAASFANPSGVAVDGSGNVYVADQSNHRIRKISPACTTPATPTISGNNTFCSGGSTVLTSSAATGNLWSTGQTTESITVTSAGDYFVRVIDGTCTSEVSSAVSVSVTALPTTPTISGNNFVCSGSSTVLTSSASTGNLWSTGDTTRTITVNTAGNYSVSVVSGGCTSAVSSEVAVSQITLNRPQVSVSTNNLIAGDSAILTILNPNTGSEYVWSNGAIGTRIVIRVSDTLTAQERLSGCLSESSTHIIITSGKKSIATTKFEMFPNPATDKVTVNTNGTGTLEILNTVGQVVITQPAIETNEIDVSKLTHGVYIVRFNGASQKLVVR